jgi:hypothetical protein
MKPKLYKSRTWLYKRRVTEGKTVEEMAKEAKTSEMSIRRALEQAGLT